MHSDRYIGHILRDLFIVTASVIVAFVLVSMGIIEGFIEATSSSLVISSFIAGAFFTSIFTVAPAGVALVAIGQTFPPILVSFFGAVGAVLVDMVIISFVRKGIAQDLGSFSRHNFFRHHIIKAFHFGFLKWVAFLLGMFVIASPLPDEAGLFLIGISKINPRFLPLVLFLAHFLGILAVVSIATSV